MAHYINVTSPAVDLPWTAGAVNRFEWIGLYWNASEYNYAQDLPFDVDIYPADLPICYRDCPPAISPSGANLFATFTLQGTNGTTGVNIPAKTKPGPYRFQFGYFVAAPSGNKLDGISPVFAHFDFTIVEPYEGSTTSLTDVSYLDAASQVISGAGVASLAVASVMACVFLFPALF